MHDPEIATAHYRYGYLDIIFQWSVENAKRLLSLRVGPGRVGAEDPLDQLRRAVGQPRECTAVPGSAASTKRISAESECEPVFFMTAAR